MMSDKQLRWVSDKVYWTEKKRTDVKYHPEKNKKYFYDDEDKNLGQFQVTEEVEDNISNGMQAMAVAPIINGKVDDTQIVNHLERLRTMIN